MLYIGDKAPVKCYFNGKKVLGIYANDDLLWPPVYTITATVDPAASGTVTGTGQYREGETCTLVATVSDGYEFTGWKENGETVSEDETYSFTVTGDRTFEAEFSIYTFNTIWQTATLTRSREWADICFGNGTFVVISSDEFLYSADGINWSAATVSTSGVTNKYWRCALHNGSKFVAFDSDYARVSTGGTSWANYGGFPNVAKFRAAYGDGVCATLATLSSSKMIYYTTKNSDPALSSSWGYLNVSGSFTGWGSIAYGDGKFVATAKGTNTAYSFIYGVGLSSATLPASANWTGVAYGGGTFAAVASGTNIAAYSADGAMWNAAELPASDNWQDVAYGNGKFVAIAANSDKVAYSKDGIVWRLMDNRLPAARNWKRIVYGGNKFVAIASGSSAAAYGIA